MIGWEPGGSRTGPLWSGSRVGTDRVGYQDSGNTPWICPQEAQTRAFFDEYRIMFDLLFYENNFRTKLLTEAIAL